MYDPNIQNEEISVKSRQATIQRCPHDNENPYAQINRDLIGNASLSPECRWLIIYLLSMQNGLRINPSQLLKDLEGHMIEKKLYKVINEAIEAGYMIKITKDEGDSNE